MSSGCTRKAAAMIVILSLLHTKSEALYLCVPVKGAVDLGTFDYVHSYACMLCINFQELCASLLGDIPPFFMLLTFISCFVIDFLSI